MKLPWFRHPRRPKDDNVDSSYLLDQTEMLEAMYQQAAQRARQLDGFALPPAGYLEPAIYGVSPFRAGCPQKPEGGVSTLLHGPGLISAPVCADCGELYRYAGYDLTAVPSHRWEHRDCPGEPPEAAAESEDTAPPGSTDSDATASAGLANER